MILTFLMLSDCIVYLKNIEYDYGYKWNVFKVNVFGRVLGDKLERKTATHEKITKMEERRLLLLSDVMVWYWWSSILVMSCMT